jgi:RHS repeat-associated protein
MIASKNNAFGMVMPERIFSNEKYRWGFNGKETDNETNWQDYGFRIYYPGLAKFLSVDPLTKGYPWYTPYQFAGNSPILFVDIDGLEPAKVKQTTKCIIIVVQGWAGGFNTTAGNPPKNNTQALNNAKTNPAAAPDGGLGRIQGANSETEAFIYASSTNGNTVNDIKTTIADFKTNNPEGKVVVVGHSLGAANAIEATKGLADGSVDLLITLDPSSYGGGMSYGPEFADLDMRDNKAIKNAVNYKITSDANINFSGKMVEDGVAVNIQLPTNKGIDHKNIDNTMTPYIIQDINNLVTRAKNPVEYAKDRDYDKIEPKPNTNPNGGGTCD